jgi:NTP pyrophosphatase (non-canonical NTP hydrolase)
MSRSCKNCDAEENIGQYGLCSVCRTEYEDLSSIVNCVKEQQDEIPLLVKYREAVKRTESPNFCEIDPRIIHAALGIGTEAGELQDVVKKTLFYGQELNMVNAFEEIGDLLWYVMLLCIACDWSLEQIIDANIEKLRLRYPKQFAELEARQRNISAEQASLEKAVEQIPDKMIVKESYVDYEQEGEEDLLEDEAQERLEHSLDKLIDGQTEEGDTS